MSENIRHPSAVALSAQNLAFAPTRFLGASTQAGNIPLQFSSGAGQRQGPQNTMAPPSNIDLGRQAQKMREYEQQRSKLQQWNTKGASAANTDAMIAQMLGRSLASNMSPAGTTNRPTTAQGPATFYSNQNNFTSSSGPYLAGPRLAAHVSESGHSRALNCAPMPQFAFPGSGLPPSSLQLAPRDLESMMHHVAGLQLGNDKVTAGGQIDLSSQTYQTMSPMGGVFVIPTFPSVVSPDGKYYNTGSAAIPYAIPRWCRDEAKLPEQYQKYFHACLPPSQPYGAEMPDTGLVYILLRTSGLANEILGAIWALANRSHPGQLTKEEFFAVLALVALAQETGAVANWDVLCSLSSPPIPRLSLSALTGNATAAYSTAASAPSSSPSTSSVIGYHPPAGNICSTSTISAVSTPAAPLPWTTTTAVEPTSTDDFDEFTDFQTAVLPPATGSTTSATLLGLDESESSTDSQDKYKALRGLTDPVDCSTAAQPTRETGFQPNPIRKASNDVNEIDMARYQAAAAATKRQSADHLVDDINCQPVINQLANQTFSNADPSSTSVVHDFSASGIAAAAAARKRSEARVAAGFSQNVSSVPKKNLNDLLRQACDSLDLGGGGSSPGSGGKHDEDTVSVRSESKEPSIHSLDLHSIKHFDLDQESVDVENQNIPVHHVDNRTSSSPAGSISLVDRYAAFRENGNVDGELSSAEKHVDAWTKCLEACLHLMKQAEKIFSSAECDNVRKEMLGTDRGSKYLRGIVQIYRVSRRIRLSLQTTAFQTDKLIDILTHIEVTWTTLCSIVAFSGILPTPENLDFRNAVIQPGKEIDEHEKKSCCGVCLLNVNASCKTDGGTSFDYKLTYGGRQYHAQCANLWINCIDSVLPALDIPCLL